MSRSIKAIGVGKSDSIRDIHPFEQSERKLAKDW